MRVVIIMPTLNPRENFKKVVTDLKSNFEDIIIVNDGSNFEYDSKFEEAKKLGCNIIKHDINKGKGEGIKTGIRSAIELYPDCDGIITVDSDGQHLIKDILNVKEKLEKENEIVFGVRDFSAKHIPFRNKFGNRFSSMFFKLKTGMNCPDTQTGLRAIPRKYLELCLDTPGSRFEYEMNFLTKIADDKMKISFVPIEAVYEKKNYTSHFRPIRDSILIYGEQLRFLISSLFCAVLDVTVFHLISGAINVKLLGTVAIATVIARIISGILNFMLNRKWAFKSSGKIDIESRKYLCLFTVQMVLSFMLVYLFGHLSEKLTSIKIVVDFILFLISYVIQRKYIFKK